MSNFILVANPGSSSRKYALYCDNEELCTLRFEQQGRKIVGLIQGPYTEGYRAIPKNFHDFSRVTARIDKILHEEAFFNGKIETILIRVVATGDYFTEDHIVDEKCIEALKKASDRTPLHVPVVLEEIEILRKVFRKAKIITISDSAFHTNRPGIAKYYAIDKGVADKFEIKRYGAHGISVAAVVHTLKEHDMLAPKTIVCHIGSGVSVTAVRDGKCLDTTMGYSPLEGAMMATRSGNIDVSAALALKRALNLSDDGLEKYLNKNCGLAGMTEDGSLPKIMQNLNNHSSAFAYRMFIYRLQIAIGQMAAALGGADELVLTATVSERSEIVRADVIKALKYLGFSIDEKKNIACEASQDPVNIGRNKPIIVVKTDETAEMIRRAKKFLQK